MVSFVFVFVAAMPPYVVSSIILSQSKIHKVLAMLAVLAPRALLSNGQRVRRKAFDSACILLNSSLLDTGMRAR